MKAKYLIAIKAKKKTLFFEFMTARMRMLFIKDLVKEFPGIQYAVATTQYKRARQ